MKNRFLYHVLQSPEEGADGGGSGGGEPPAKAPAETPPEQGITQAQIDAIVKDRLARQKATFEKTLSELGVEGGLDGLKQTYQEQQEAAREAAKQKGQYKGLYEAEQKRAAELEAKFNQIEVERREAKVREALTSLASDSVAPGQVAQLMQADLARQGLQVMVRDGTALIVDQEGMPCTDGAGGYLTAAAKYAEFQKANPWFARATAPPGGGAGSRPAAPAPPDRLPAGGNPFGDLSTTEAVEAKREEIMAAMRRGEIS